MAQATECSRLRGFKSFLDQNGRAFINQFEKFDHVRVPHAHTAMTRGGADLVLMFRAVNIDESLPRIGIFFIQSIQPQDTGHDQVLRWRGRVVELERDAAYKNSAVRRVASNLAGNAKTSGRRFQASLLRANAKSRRGYRKGAHRLLVLAHRKPLMLYRYVDCFHSQRVSDRDKIPRQDYNRELMGGYHIAIVGATGAAGSELLRVLERRNFPVASLRPIGSARSAGKSVKFRGESIPVETLDRRSFEKIDISFFSAGGDVSREYVPIACQADAIAIDKSSAFRMDPHVPLMIPEINAQDLGRHRGVIANPNCTTTVMLMALYPLHSIFRVKRVIVASYQAVSGSGTRGVEELRRQIEEVARGPEVEDMAYPNADSQAGRSRYSEIFPHQIAFNLLPHVDSFLESGYTKEEQKMQDETRKIMHLSRLRLSATCVRVPVYRAHSVAVTAEFERPVSVQQAHEVLSKAPGLELVDEPQGNRYPMPISVAGRDNCQVGRVRLDCAFENGLSFWVAGDQLLKGAALNAVQIAELL